MKNTNVLVTGSQGFIGSYLCNELLDHGYNVVGVDNFSKYGRVHRHHDKHENFGLIETDVCSDSFRNAFNKKSLFFHDTGEIDYIVAGAAMIGGISYFHKYAYDLLKTNEAILGSTFDTAIDLYKKRSLKRIIVLSSSMVFENTSVYPTPETEIKKCPPPMSTYGFQKLSCEYFCKGAHEQYGLPYTIIRPFNCVGIGEDEALNEEETTVGSIKMLMSHVLPDLIHRAMQLDRKDKFPILGGGNQVRHYTHGKDIARGIRIAMESERAVLEDYNISHHRPVTVEELATLVWWKIHGNYPVFENLKPYPYDVQKRSPDVTKAKDHLEFTAKIDLEETIDEVITWMRKKSK